MKLVLDSNIIFSALIKKSTTRDIILSDIYDLYAPEYVFTEITEHKELLLRKSKMNEEDFDALLLLLQKHIHLVSKENYNKKMAHFLNIRSPAPICPESSHITLKPRNTNSELLRTRYELLLYSKPLRSKDLFKSADEDRNKSNMERHCKTYPAAVQHFLPRGERERNISQQRIYQ